MHKRNLRESVVFLVIYKLENNDFKKLEHYSMLIYSYQAKRSFELGAVRYCLMEIRKIRSSSNNKLRIRQNLHHYLRNFKTNFDLS